MSNNESTYQLPRHPQESECSFFHTVELNGRVIDGVWDLREDEEAHLGGVDVRGKRVLDLGTAGGHMAFYMESKGAEVVAFDIENGRPYEFMAHTTDPTDHADGHIKGSHQMKNGFWLMHGARRSKVKVVYGDLYQLPQDMGRFNIGFISSILLHLERPFSAIRQVALLTDDTIIITDAYRNHYLPTPHMVFRPDHANIGNCILWWYIPPESIIKMLEVFGFGQFKVSYHSITNKLKQHNPLYTVVGKRVGPTR